MIDFPYEDPTYQQVFDHVLLFLRKQGKASVSPHDGICLYRSPDGLACAIGCLISDPMYSEKMEDNGIRALVDKAMLSGSLEWMTRPSMISFLRRLQIAHDGPLKVGYIQLWEKDMEEIAAEEGLAYIYP